MSITDPVNAKQMSQPNEGTPPVGETDEELRNEAIASLERKRKFTKDAFGYVTVNGVLWVIWVLSDRSSDSSMPWPAWVSAIWGFFLAIDAWKAYGPWPKSLSRSITEADIELEMKRSRRG